MTDTLTESFCERCGTRYEFSAPTRLNPLRKTRGLIGGLKNYLTSQDALSDAVGDAIRGEEGALATAQLDAFHEAFNFCIDCRQYTCLNCWNDDAGRCRTCAPIPGTDDLVERLTAAAVAEQPGMIAEGLMTDDDLQRRLAGEQQWPTSDLPTVAAMNGHVEEPWPVTQETTTPVAPPSPAGFVGADGFVYETQERADAVAAQLESAPEPVATEVDELPAGAAAELETEALAAEIVLEPEPASAEAEPPHPPLRVVAWDQDAAFDLEPEPIVAEVEPEPIVAEVEPEPIVAEVDPEPVVAEVAPEPEPEPVGTTAQMWPEPEPAVAEAEPEPEPEPVAAEAEPTELPHIAPVSETILHFPQRPPPPAEAPPEAPAEAPAVAPDRLAAADQSPEVAARRAAQMDLLGLGGAETAAEPPAVLPYRSRGAAITQAELAARAAAGTFWEASAREVAGAVGNVGIQSCGECGLSLSANARFCRRCGTRQARSA